MCACVRVGKGERERKRVLHEGVGGCGRDREIEKGKERARRTDRERKTIEKDSETYKERSERVRMGGTISKDRERERKSKKERKSEE